MLLDFDKLGSLREIERTDMRSVLLFMFEYPQFKNAAKAEADAVPAYADEVTWM
jgi:hypothetical protein